MTVPVIRPLPPAPVRADAPADFSAKADAFVAALPGFGSDIQAVGNYVDDRAGDAASSAAAAEDSVGQAEAAVLAAQQEVQNAQQKVDDAQAAANAAAGFADDAEAHKTAAEVAAAAAQSAAGLPAVEGKARRPLRVNEGGTGVEFGGALQLPGIIEDTVLIGSATGAVDLDVSLASVFDITLSGNAILSFSGVVPSGTTATTAFVVRIRQGSPARTVTWPAGITWLTSTGTAPAAPAANKIREYVLSTEDGATWLGRGGAGN